ncbi:MAG: aminotransferase class I/II-fold pyridoxal phosphate-dependent enzyme, partial [Bdellovibrionia bacterium]
MENRYTLAADSFGAQEIEAAIGVLRSGNYTMGAKVKEFERALADWAGVKDAIMVNSGSSANLLLVDSLMRRLDQAEIKIRPGDEVIVPMLSWPTTVWPLVQLGLVPVFADIDLDTLAISLDSAEKLITPKTKGMFLIHVLGQAAPMKDYVEFCRKYGLTLIEDCCESFGAYDQG